MKIVAIGAGSYVFGPSLLAQTYLEQSMDRVELDLVDPDIETITLMAGVGRRLARERNLETKISTHAEWSTALDGADFVICSASPQMQRRTATDWAIIDEILPGHAKTEFGGVAGISYSLRQIALIESLAGDMRRLCPQAWLLNVSNPLPRVCQAAQENKIQTAGFCAVSSSVYAILWDIMHGAWLDFPFAPARDAWNLTTAGLNHFAWLVDFRDRLSGGDLMPMLRDRLREKNAVNSNPRSQGFVRQLGYLLVPGDDHTRDFLEPESESSGPAALPWHGSPEQRQQRLERLRLVGEGTLDWDGILRSQAWEKPLQFIDALTGGPPADFHAMNLLNCGQVTNLSRHVFVETPCRVTDGHVESTQVTLPESVLPLCDRTARVTDTIVRAARERNRKLVHEAVRIDPTVLDKAAGIAAIDACIAAHSDILPAYT